MASLPPCAHDLIISPASRPGAYQRKETPFRCATVPLQSRFHGDRYVHPDGREPFASHEGGNDWWTFSYMGDCNRSFVLTSLQQVFKRVAVPHARLPYARWCDLWTACRATVGRFSASFPPTPPPFAFSLWAHGSEGICHP